MGRKLPTPARVRSSYLMGRHAAAGMGFRSGSHRGHPAAAPGPRPAGLLRTGSERGPSWHWRAERKASARVNSPRRKHNFLRRPIRNMPFPHIRQKALKTSVHMRLSEYKPAAYFTFVANFGRKMRLCVFFRMATKQQKSQHFLIYLSAG